MSRALQMLVHDFVDEVFANVETALDGEPELPFSPSERAAFELEWEQKILEVVKAGASLGVAL